MPRQEKVKRSEVVPITEVQQHEINIAKQRLATAKLQAAASSQSLNASKESQKIAKKMLFNADKNLMLSQNQYDMSQKELHDAEKMLLNAEKRYAAVTEEEDTTSLQLDNLANAAAAEEDKSLQLEGHVDNNNLANAKKDSNKKRKADTVSSTNNQQVDGMQTLSADSKQENNKKRKAPSLHTADQKQEGVNKKRKTVTTGSGEWTNTEHKQFKEGIIKYGWGCWKELADNIISTRDRHQVKSRAQKLKKNHPDVVANLIREHEKLGSSHTTIKKEKKKKKKKTPQRSNRQGSTTSSFAKARVPVVHHHQITPPTTISASKLLSDAITKVENDINGQGSDKTVAAAAAETVAAAACDELGPLF